MAKKRNMATINASQDYDFISTLTFDSASGNCNIELNRGSAYAGTVYYRAGTSGSWTSLSVIAPSIFDDPTTFPVSSTTMQVANDWNKSGNDYMTQSFKEQSSNLTEIAISQKAVLSGVIGNNFMTAYARDCSSLTSLSVPDTSSVTSVGDDFMRFYSMDCSSLTSLSIPDTSSITSVGDFFMGLYANDCSSLTSLSVPDTSSVTSVGDDFMRQYARDCSSLERLELPEIGWFASNNVDWSVPSGRLNNLKGYVQNSTDLSDWQGVTSSGETLHTNYIRSTSDVINENAFTNNSNFLAFMQ